MKNTLVNIGDTMKNSKITQIEHKHLEDYNRAIELAHNKITELTLYNSKKNTKFLIAIMLCCLLSTGLTAYSYHYVGFLSSGDSIQSLRNDISEVKKNNKSMIKWFNENYKTKIKKQ